MEEHELALNKAKIALMYTADSAFFTTLLFSLRIFWDPRIPTAATNGTKIFLNPKFFMSLSPEERVFLLLHETLHCAYLHMIRLKDLEQDRGNMAADYVINLQLVERGFVMPKNGLLNHDFKDMHTKQVYDLLEPQCTMPKGIPKDLMEPAGNPELTEAEMQDILVRAEIQSKVSEDKLGTIPGEIQIFLDKLLRPKLPWNRILQKYLHSFAKTDYSFRKLNRRFFPKHLLPSLYSNQLMKIGIAIDASGSVTDTDFNRFVTETHSILRMMQPESISLIHFDTEIRAVNNIKNVRELMQVRFTGRGGTKIEPVLEWANKNKPQLLLIFTDGFFKIPKKTTKTDLIWLIHENPKFTFPTGKVIHYEV